MLSLAPSFNNLGTSTYQVRIADTMEEVEAAQRLRYKVFNLELGEGLAASDLSGLDQDQFDSVCDHLIVLHQPTGKVIGTYRMQTGACAAAHFGYYSAQEFDFTPYEPIRQELLELGRACIHRDHRNLSVLNLLWRGIARYARKQNIRYLMGCSSLTTQDPRLGLATALQLRTHLAPTSFLTQPLPAYRLPDVAPLDPCPSPPRLLRAYLSVGAKLCGPPALDQTFGTIDFLTLMDLHGIPGQIIQHFGIKAT
jgi:putative hemolysin